MSASITTPATAGTTELVYEFEQLFHACRKAEEDAAELDNAQSEAREKLIKHLQKDDRLRVSAGQLCGQGYSAAVVAGDRVLALNYADPKNIQLMILPVASIATA